MFRPPRILSLLLLLAAAGTAARAADVPPEDVGRIVDAGVVRSAEDADRVLVDLVIRPAYEEGRTAGGGTLANFDEEKVIVEPRGTALTIWFEMVGLGAEPPELPPEIGFLKRLAWAEEKGSHLDTGTTRTTDGRPVSSASLTVESDERIFYQLREIDRGTPGEVVLRFIIERAGQNGREPAVTTLTVDMAEMDVEAARVPGDGVPGMVGGGEDRPELRAALERLERLADEDFATVHLPLHHLDPDEAEELLKHKVSLLGSIEPDRNNPALLVTDRADYLRSLLAVLPALDRPVPQAEIEVRILEVQWNTGERLGFSWNASRGEEENRFDRFGLATGAARMATGGSVARAVFGKLDDDGFDVIEAKLDLLAREGRVALLAQPKLLVKSNATATFHAGVTVPVVAYSDDENPSYLEETRSGTREVPAPGDYDWPAEEEYYQRRSRRAQPGKQDTVDLGVTLEIKPRIAPGGMIDLWLEPSVSEIAGWRPEHDVPIVMEREVSTTVRARNGETIFIGGLFQESGISEMRGIPLMQRLPGVGRLFRSDEAERRQTEVVFILHIRVVE